MTRRVVALVLGLTAVGVVSALILLTKGSGVSVSRPEGVADTSQLNQIRIVLYEDGAVDVDGRAVDPNNLEQEFVRILTRSEAADLPQPSFSIVAHEEVDNARIVVVMDALIGVGASQIAIEPDIGF